MKRVKNFFCFILCYLIYFCMPVYAVGIDSSNAKILYEQCIDGVGWAFIGIGFFEVVKGLFKWVMGTKDMQSQKSDEGSMGLAIGIVVILLGLAIPPIIKTIFVF